MMYTEDEACSSATLDSHFLAYSIQTRQTLSVTAHTIICLNKPTPNDLCGDTSPLIQPLLFDLTGTKTPHALANHSLSNYF